MATGPFGVDLDAAVTDIHSSASTAAPAAAEAVDTDAAPDTAFSGESVAEPQTAGDPNQAGIEGKPAPEETGTEFGLTPDGKINLFGKTFTPAELLLQIERADRAEQARTQWQKFEEHFEADMPRLRRDPGLVYEMQKAGYPKALVDRAALMLRAEGIAIPGRGERAVATPVSSAENTKEIAEKRKLTLEDLDPELAKRLEESLGFVSEQKVNGLADQVGRIYDRYDAEKKVSPELSKQAQKLADAELQALSSKGHNLLDENGRLRTDIVQHVYKSAHQSLKTQLDKRVRSVVTAQKKANSGARDAGNGGVVPTRPAEKPKTVREARNQWLNEVGG